MVEKDTEPRSYNFMKQEGEELNCELGSLDSEVHNIRSTGLQTAEKVKWKNMYHTSPVTSTYSKVS
jgi:hypothetical protein